MAFRSPLVVLPYDLLSNPESFNPDRFFNGPDKPVSKPEQFVPFGIGKRICMGESLARNEIFIFFIMILQHYKISVAKNHPAPDPTDYTQGITTIPKPFYVNIQQR